MNTKFLLIVAGVSGGLLMIVFIAALIFAPRAKSGQSNDQRSTPTLAQRYDPEVTPMNGKAVIKGRICSPPEDPTEVSATLIVAERLPARTQVTKYYPGYATAGSDLYAIEVDPGIYEVYTQSANREKVALYSDYVECGMEETCVDHGAVQVSLARGQVVEGVDLCDYVWRTRFQ